ncbi:MAG: PD40 domain-containing protein, partial [Mucilaginibacter sp.]|nr:PD40 domain-containing protein [Mucilaginibacter sp.]
DGRILDDISMGKAEQFSNLSWSPDGKSVVFQGMSEGQSDLYLYNFDNKQVRQLTNDKYSDYQPNFSKDGKRIIYSSDRATYDKTLSQAITFNLAELDLATGKVTDINVFNGANNLNPQYSADGSQVYFLSNRDGFRNLYRYTFAGGKVEQMTDLFTGISGITEFSPALSISNNDDVVYSYYRAQKYSVYNAKASDFKAVTVDAGATDYTAALLPPTKAVGVDLINSNLNNYLAYRKIPVDSIHAVAYKPKFKLDALASSGIGVGVNSVYGAGLSSGVQGVFSDILGRNQIYAGAAVNGEIYDFGASFLYLNQKGRWTFGAGASHIPYQSGYYGYDFTTRTIDGKEVPVYEERTDIIRTFEDAVQGVASYPFSRTLRAEFGATASRYSYRVDRYSSYYNYVTSQDANGNQFTSIGYQVDFQKHKISREQFLAENGIDLRAFQIYGASASLVGDDSYFGIAAPLGGHRFRIEAEYNVGTYNFFSPTIDLRKYVRARPVTFAARLYGYGRFGNTSNNLYPLYVGYPFLIRGYESQTFYNANRPNTNGFTIDQLSGSRIAVANFEVRLPFTGPEKLAAIKSKFLFTDLNLFFDAGLAWNGGNEIKFQRGPDVIGQTQQTDQNGNPLKDANGNPVMQTVYNTNQRVPALSAGISLRVNLFGAIILEPYYAIPFNRTDIKTGVFGLNFTPGW